MLNKNDIITLRIDSVSNDGNGVGRSENMVIFVPCAAPGDLLEVRIIKQKKDYAFGRIEAVIEAASCRTDAACSSFGRCGGCSFRHITYPAELEIKHDYVTGTLRRIGGIDCDIDPVIPSIPDIRYRNKVQLPVFSTDGVLSTGFYAKRSHRIVPFDDGCLQDPPIMHEIASYTSTLLTGYGVTAYDEVTQRGLLRHLILRQSSLDSSIMLILVLNGNRFEGEEGFAEAITRKYPCIESIVVNTNRENTNVIAGRSNRVIYGQGYLSDLLAGISLRISPNSFLQINHYIAQKLYAKVKEYLEPDRNMTVLDLYCGIGSIGLSVAADVNRVIGVEINKAAVADALFNAALNGLSNTEYIAGDAENELKKIIDRGTVVDTVIVDPPRKGCDAAVIDSITALDPKKIIMVSCDPATLARDLLYLQKKGYVSAGITVFDMFPRTVHTESAALMIKKNR